MAKKEQEEKDRLKQLEKENQRLKKLLQEKNIKADFLRKMIELAEEELNIDIDSIKKRMDSKNSDEEH